MSIETKNGTREKGREERVFIIIIIINLKGWFHLSEGRKSGVCVAVSRRKEKKRKTYRLADLLCMIWDYSTVSAFIAFIT